jgi:ferredoxin--NADP+ reductase
MLEGTCKAKGINYDEWLSALRHKNQWHVEVY